MPEQYKVGERVRVIVEGAVAHVTDGEELYPGELTIALENPAGLYDVTVPLDAVTVERLVPAEGEPQPGDIWKDSLGVERFAYLDSPNGEILLQDADGVVNLWRHFHIEYGPLTKVYRPKPAEEPTLRVGDRWLDDEGDVWKVVHHGGQVLLHMTGTSTNETWSFVSAQYGPLTRVEKAEPYNDFENGPATGPLGGAA
ncbi:hypothetical protein [Streptosporangium sp. NPDC051022]|uniref:hypothetical protein n=1 Tax=Streptosporangium sp. NPDC051022 TaxID=3155752 RepID=UPI00342CB285